MSDITREDLRVDVSTIGSPHHGETRPVSDADALRLLLTDPCERCGGTGQTKDPTSLNVIPTIITCTDCGGRGWKLRDAVVTDGRPRWSRPMICFPAEWLEASE